MGTNKNVVVSFSIAILLLLSLLLLLTYNSKCNQSHNTAGPAMQSSQNFYNVGNYSNTPEPFYIEKFSEAEPFTQEEQFNNPGGLPVPKGEIAKWEKEHDGAKRAICKRWKNMGLDTTVYELNNGKVKCNDVNADTAPERTPEQIAAANAAYKNLKNNNTSKPASIPASKPASAKSNINNGVGNFRKYQPFTDYGEGMNIEEGFNNYEEGMTVEQMADLASVQMSNEVSPQWSARANQQTQNSPMMSSQGPAGSFNGDSSFQPVSNMGGGMGGGGGGSNQQGMQSCFPRDRLTADDLLPKDAADSKWAQINPSGGGNISDQNYLTAGYHVGVNTVGQSLRNANLQLRSEIPNPQDAVGPWMISTIEPDLRQNTLEIGSSISY
jgi:hypothetical protein